MNLEEMKKRKKEMGFTNESLAKAAGVPLGTVQKIFAGITKSPRYDTLMALENVLEPRTVVKEQTAPFISGSNAESREDGYAQYGEKKQGEYTVEDFLAMPEDSRVELIDGVLYDMASPIIVHQVLCGWMFFEIQQFVSSNNGDCLPIISPSSVQLDCDDKTMVIPDIYVVCDRSKLVRTHAVGAPDLVIEILSPSTGKRDMTLKLYKYQNAGVREYWIVDPEKQRIMIYDFENEDILHLYSFDDKVPVAIWDGECILDFSEFKEKYGFLL